MSARYSFVALDLDGTILNSDHELTERTVNILRKLSSHGVTIGIATGRSTRNVLQYLLQLNLPQRSVPLVCFNGSYGFIYSQSQCTTVFEDPLPSSLAIQILNFAKDQGCVAQYYNGATGDVYAVPLTDEHVTFLQQYEKLVGHPQVVLPTYDMACETCLPAKILIMTNRADHIIEKANVVLPHNELTIIRGSPQPFFVEFLRDDVNKGSGLQKLCRQLGVSMEEVISFGDGDNDKEMLSLSGLGCAMKNAKSVARDAARLVLEWTNDEDGVAKQLEHMYEKGEFKLHQ